MNGGGADITRFRTPDDAQRYFDEKLWKPYQGDVPSAVSSGQREPPAAAPAAAPAPAAKGAAPAARTSVTRQEVLETARKHGVPASLIEAQLRQKGVTITEGAQ